MSWADKSSGGGQDYDNTNRGALFPNTYKDNEKQPDVRGPLDVDGVEFKLSGWTQTDKNGNKFLSLAVERKDEQKPQKSSDPIGELTGTATPPVQTLPKSEAEGEDVPF